jgi:hypothetical protein
MSDQKRLDSEKLVEAYRARTEWEGEMLLGFLRENGIEAELQRAPAVPPLDAMEELSGAQRVHGIFVIEHNAAKAKDLVQQFLSAVTDDKLLEEAAARKLHLNKEAIGRLRRELSEERRTFNALGWLFVIFLGASALLWAIWPAWLKTAPPDPSIRWVMVIMLALAAVFAGNWANQKMR